MFKINFCLMQQNPLTCAITTTSVYGLTEAQKLWDILDNTCRMLSPRPQEAVCITYDV